MILIYAICSINCNNLHFIVLFFIYFIAILSAKYVYMYIFDCSLYSIYD